MSVTGSKSRDAQLTKTTVFLTRVRKRVEITTVDGVTSQSVVTITCPDLGEVITANPGLKVYKVEPIQSLLQMLAFPDFPILVRSSDASHWSDITGITGQEHGSDTVDGVMSDHLILDVHNSDSTGAGKPSDVSIDYWISAVNTGYAISYSGQIQRPDGSTVSYNVSGDHKLVDQLTQKVPSRIVIHSVGREDLQMDLVNYSSAPIASSDFDTPANYQLVTPDQYQQMQVNAIPPPQMSIVQAQPPRT